MVGSTPTRFRHIADDCIAFVGVKNIQSKGGLADAIRADLATTEGAGSLAKEDRSIVGDRLDIFVANAGVSKSATIKDHTVEDFDNLFSTNVRSPFFLVQQILPILGLKHCADLFSGSPSCCWEA
jgi:NAD(P)-dependent dehydrogenase (short-subunit alcohol dehydrogenase family)